MFACFARLASIQKLQARAKIAGRAHGSRALVLLVASLADLDHTPPSKERPSLTFAMDAILARTRPLGT